MFSNEKSIGRFVDADYDKDKREINVTFEPNGSGIESIAPMGVNLEIFELGDIINHKKYGEGVVFKTLADNNFWVAFPHLKDERIFSEPCHQEVFNGKELEKFREN